MKRSTEHHPSYEDPPEQTKSKSAERSGILQLGNFPSVEYETDRRVKGPSRQKEHQRQVNAQSNKSTLLAVGSSINNQQ